MHLGPSVSQMYTAFNHIAYAFCWKFRGMAFPGEDGKLELTIEDYPYANDGLLIWDSIKGWVSDYVKHYYSSAVDIVGDKELQEFWTEVRTRGHADKQDEPWWPRLDSHGSLIQVLSTIIWVASGHHAAVNFPQYPYAGYFPNRPEEHADGAGMRGHALVPAGPGEGAAGHVPVAVPEHPRPACA